MLLHAFCHRGGVKTTDHRGRRRAFNFRTPVRSVVRFHSESESEPPEVIRAFADDGTLGLAVLPPGFNL